MRIDTQRLSDATHFVCKSDLQCVESITCVLEHFGSPDRGAHELARQIAEHALQHLEAVVVGGAHHRKGRIVVVADRRAFAQELGLKAEAEIPAGLETRRFLDRRLDHAFDGARLHSGANDNDVARVLFAKCGAELRGDPRDCTEILAAVARGRGTDADERNIRGQHCVPHVLSDMNAAAAHDRTRQLLNASFDDRCLSRLQKRELRRVDVDAGDLVTIAGETRERHSADVSEAEDADAPPLTGRDICFVVRLRPWIRRPNRSRTD